MRLFDLNPCLCCGAEPGNCDPGCPAVTEPRVLRLTINREYFDAIANGTKTTEYRARSPHWEQRLGGGRNYDQVLLLNGYGPDVPALRCRFLGCTLEKITHPHFGPRPVKVYAIQLADPELLNP